MKSYLKYLDTWVGIEGNAEFGQDIIIDRNEKIIIIEWLWFNHQTTCR